MAKINKEEIKIDKSQEILKEMLKDESGHFNYIQPRNYTISTGSLNLDLETGGIKNSIIRCSGMAEAGKTSFSLNIIKNFLEDKTRKRRGIYFLSDKELSDDLVKRSGVKFVEDLDNFIDGTCYIIRTNIYETVCNTIKKIIQEKETEYIFVLDSMDNFAPKSALEGDFGDSFQKGGTSAISAHFFRCFNILLPRLGHTTILISQFRDTVNISRYAPPVQKQTSSSGGRAIEHAVSWAFEFQIPMSSKEDMFWEGEPYKSKKLGHNCIIQFKKSTNEKTGNKVKYPIIYGRAEGKSIWIEREIFDQLLIWGMIKSKGAWNTWSESIYKELLEIDKDVPLQIQGTDNVVKFLESKPQISEFLYKKFKDILSKEN
jgi:RecA/RadA recombinase